MTIEELIADFILWRGVERLIALAIGALSIILGYHLFRIGVVAQQESIIQKGDLKLHLVKVGPGVFFSLFGAVLVGYVAYVQLELREVVDSSERRTLEVVGFSPGRVAELKRLVPATNSLRDIVAALNLDLRSSLSADEQDLLNRLSVVSARLQEVSTSALLEFAPPEVRSACTSGESVPDGVDRDVCKTLTELEDSRL